MSTPNFNNINAAALSRYPGLLESWLPGGRLQGREYVCGDLAGGPGESLSVNTESGVWSDFATGDKGGDPVSLYAAIRALGQGEAARELAETLGVGSGAQAPAEREALRQRIKQDRAAQEKALAERQAEASYKARKILAEAQDCTSHAYLTRKGVKPCHGLKVAQDGRLVVPVLGADGKAQSLQLIDAKGGKRFLTGGRVAGGYFAIKGENGPLFLAEGLATGLTVTEATGATVLCAFNAGNLAAVARMAREKYPARELVVAADNDRKTEGNPGLTKGREAARAVGGKLAAPAFPEGAGGSDWNDLAAVAGLDELRRQLAEAQEPEATKCEVPEGFQLRKGGVYFLAEDKDGNRTPEWLCSPLRVLALTRDAEGAAWGRLLEVEDPDGRPHPWAMPMSLTAGDGAAYREHLLSLGLRLAPGNSGKNRLGLYLSLARPTARARCVPRIGWHGRRFVLPDMVYGPAEGEETILQGAAVESAFRASGTLVEWQEHIGRLCIGNSRLVLAVSAALAGPLLQPISGESGGLHFVGGSSLGKTTSLLVAGSACGGGGVRGFVRTWRATDNGLEAVAVLHCDSLLCLDEMSEVDGKTAGNIAYMLANGTGKARARKDGTERRAQEWRLLFLSTGEITLADKVREDGRRRATAGQGVRVVDIPADAGAGMGLFENLHGSPDGDAFARRLKEASGAYYGTALRAFLGALTTNLDEMTTRATQFIKDFTERLCPPGADGQVRRVAGRFALVAAAGEAGIAAGVLPWPKGEAQDAAAKCFRAWLSGRGGIGAAEVQAGLEQVRAFLQAHGSSRFEDLDADQPRAVINRAGYRRKTTEGVQFYVFPEAFRGEVCSGLNLPLMCRELAARGWLLSESGRHTRTVRTPEGRAKMYVLNSSVLGGDSGDTGDTGDTPDITGGIFVPGAENATGDTGDKAGDGCRIVPGVPACPRSPKQHRGQEKTNENEAVSTVPGVPDGNDVSAHEMASPARGKRLLPNVAEV